MNKPLFSNSKLTRKRLTRVPLRVIVPNVVTLLALCLGITAIRFAIELRFTQAVLAILGAAVFDGLDGRIARALKGTSRFGAELDSLADFIDFGVAPALVLYMWSLSQMKSLGWFAALVYAVACALRLARFNVSLDEEDSPPSRANFFTGMPAPAGALVVLLPLYLHASALAMPNLPKLVPLEIAYMLLVSFLMVSRIPHFSGKTIGRIPRENVAAVMFAGAISILLLFTFPMETLIVLTLGYFAMIPISMRQSRRLQAGEKPEASAIN